MDTWHSVGHTINLSEVRIKRGKQKENKEKERKGGEMDREERKGREEKEALSSLYDLQRSINRLPTGQGLKSEYPARATRGYRKLQVSSRFHAKGSASRKLRVREVFAELLLVVAHASRGKRFFLPWLILHLGAMFGLG